MVDKFDNTCARYMHGCFINSNIDCIRKLSLCCLSYPILRRTLWPLCLQFGPYLRSMNMLTNTVIPWNITIKTTKYKPKTTKKERQHATMYVLVLAWHRVQQLCWSDGFDRWKPAESFVGNHLTRDLGGQGSNPVLVYSIFCLLVTQ